MLQHIMGVQIIPKANVKIQKVTDFRSMLKEGVKFSQMRKAIIVAETLIVDNKKIWKWSFNDILFSSSFLFTHKQKVFGIFGKNKFFKEFLQLFIEYKLNCRHTLQSSLVTLLLLFCSSVCLFVFLSLHKLNYNYFFSFFFFV